MFSEKEKEIARYIITGLCLPEEFDSDSDYDDYRDSSKMEEIESKVGHVDFRGGASRLVLVPENHDFVIKVDFDGQSVWNEREENLFFVPYQHQYSSKEYERTEKAKENGFSQLFLDMELVTVIHERKFYLQRKAQVIGWNFGPVVSEESLEKSRSMSGMEKECHFVWRATVVEFYGEQFWHDFIEWNYANFIGILDDVHGGNYGYRNGRPVFVDVAGFYDYD